MRFVLVLMLILSAGGLRAGDAETIARIEAAWAGWGDKVGAKARALVITRNGTIVHQAAKGMDAGEKVELASLSKAITGVCIDRLVRQGLVRYDTSIGEALGEAPRDPALAGATVGDLVTQSAGIWPDSTQEAMPRWLGSKASRNADVARTVLSRKRQRGQPGRHAYNNENYALLGRIVEKVTGKSYAAVCAGVAPGAVLSPRSGGFAAWGGWRMSLADYARFHAEHFGAGSSIGKSPGRYPDVALGGGAHYGPGVYWRASAGRFNFWHFGSYCMRGRLETTTYAVSWQGRWGVVAAYPGKCTTEAQRNALDAAFVAAVFR